MPKRGKKGGKTAIRHSENFPRSRATVILSRASCTCPRRISSSRHSEPCFLHLSAKNLKLLNHRRRGPPSPTGEGFLLRQKLPVSE